MPKNTDPFKIGSNFQLWQFFQGGTKLPAWPKVSPIDGIYFHDSSLCPTIIDVMILIFRIPAPWKGNGFWLSTKSKCKMLNSEQNYRNPNNIYVKFGKFKGPKPLSPSSLFFLCKMAPKFSYLKFAVLRFRFCCSYAVWHRCDVRTVIRL